MKNSLIKPRKRSLKFLCNLSPFISSEKIFGVEPILSCTCHNIWNNFYFSLYSSAVEIIMWLMVVHGLIISFNENILCGTFLSNPDRNHYFQAAARLMINIFYAILFSFLKRNKLKWPRNNYGYNNDGKILKQAQIILLPFFILYFSVILLALSILDFKYFPKIEKRSKSPVISHACSVFFILWHLFGYGQVNFILFLISIIFRIIMNRFQLLQKKLDSLDRNTRNLSMKVENIIIIHTYLWEIFQQTNQLWCNLFAVVYFLMTHITGLLLYLFVFSEIEIKANDLRSLYKAFVFALGFVVFIFICIKGSFFISSITSTIYGNFISIGKVSSSYMSLNSKLKILIFMKRFGRMPLGISIGGFFFLKEDLPIRVIETLYSVFSTLLELRQLGEQKTCNMNHVPTINNTSF